MLTICNCAGIGGEKCGSQFEAQYGFVPTAERIANGHGRPTVTEVLNAALCDDCAACLRLKQVKLFPLFPAILLALRPTPATSFDELLNTRGVARKNHVTLAALSRAAECQRIRENAVRGDRLRRRAAEPESMVAG